MDCKSVLMHGLLMSFTHTRWGIYYIYYGNLDLLNVESRQEQSIFSLVSINFREYLLHSVIWSLTINKATDLLAFILYCSDWAVTLLGAERLMQPSLLLYSLLCFLLFAYFLWIRQPRLLLDFKSPRGRDCV